MNRIGKKNVTKSFLISIMALFIIVNVHAQNDSVSFRLRYEFQASIINNSIFKASDLSVLDNNVQSTNIGFGMDANIRLHLTSSNNVAVNRSQNSFVGISGNITKVPISHSVQNEDVFLYSISFMYGYMFEWRHCWALDMSLEIGWAHYKNEFSTGSKDYSYSKNGGKCASTITAYFSPFSHLRIGIGAKYSLYGFTIA